MAEAEQSEDGVKSTSREEGRYRDTSSQLIGMKTRHLFHPAMAKYIKFACGKKNKATKRSTVPGATSCASSVNPQLLVSGKALQYFLLAQC